MGKALFWKPIPTFENIISFLFWGKKDLPIQSLRQVEMTYFFLSMYKKCYILNKTQHIVGQKKPAAWNLMPGQEETKSGKDKMAHTQELSVYKITLPLTLFTFQINLPGPSRVPCLWSLLFLPLQTLKRWEREREERGRKERRERWWFKIAKCCLTFIDQTSVGKFFQWLRCDFSST